LIHEGDEKKIGRTFGNEQTITEKKHGAVVRIGCGGLKSLSGLPSCDD